MRKLPFVGLALLAGALLPAGGNARVSGTAITISAQTSNKPVGGLIWATYGTAAQISGTTADGQAGTSVELQKSTFPFTAGFSAAGQTTTSAGGSYSFTAKPTIATRYRVLLAADATSASQVVTVYVGAHWINRPTSPCSGLSCHKHFANTIVYPPAVAKREASKRAYYYFGVRYGSQTSPPTRVKIVKTGRLRHLGGTRYRAGFSVTFPTVQAYYYEWVICTKDTETRDGLGLPGRHHCGGRSIRYSAIQQGYIG
jgi:hypothetical protein